MTNPEHDPAIETNEGNDQSDPAAGIERDPATNTTPPSNPPADEKAVAEGEEKLGGIVNW